MTKAHLKFISTKSIGSRFLVITIVEIKTAKLRNFSGNNIETKKYFQEE